MNDTKRHPFVSVNGRGSEQEGERSSEVASARVQNKNRLTSCLEVPDSRKEGIHCG